MSPRLRVAALLVSVAGLLLAIEDLHQTRAAAAAGEPLDILVVTFDPGPSSQPSRTDDDTSPRDGVSHQERDTSDVVGTEPGTPETGLSPA